MKHRTFPALALCMIALAPQVFAHAPYERDDDAACSNVVSIAAVCARTSVQVLEECSRPSFGVLECAVTVIMVAETWSPSGFPGYVDWTAGFDLAWCHAESAGPSCADRYGNVWYDSFADSGTISWSVGGSAASVTRVWSRTFTWADDGESGDCLWIWVHPGVTADAFAPASKGVFFLAGAFPRSSLDPWIGICGVLGPWH